jgi:hypothetical protein
MLNRITIDPVLNTKTITNVFIGLREFSTSGPNIDLYADNEFVTLIMDSNTALHTIGYIKISIYDDASGNVLTKDSNGNDILNRLVKRTDYTLSYTDISTQLFVVGFIIMTFDDDSTFSLVHDNDIDYIKWYTMEGSSPTEIKPFT